MTSYNDSSYAIYVLPLLKKLFFFLWTLLCFRLVFWTKTVTWSEELGQFQQLLKRNFDKSKKTKMVQDFIRSSRNGWLPMYYHQPWDMLFLLTILIIFCHHTSFIAAANIRLWCVHLASHSQEYKINQTKWAQKARHIASSRFTTVFKGILLKRFFSVESVWPLNLPTPN